MSDYKFLQVNGVEYHQRLLPLYRAHYQEMQDRLAGDGIEISAFNPRTDIYFPAMDKGEMLTFIVALGDKIVGYSNIWLTHDMHNKDFIAQEDTIYIARDHRKGIGRKLVKHILGHLEAIGVRRVSITPVTDLRVGKIWQRMGFKPVAEIMTYTFEGN